MATSTVENYVKQLYLEQQRAAAATELIPLGKLAVALGVVPGTVTTMVRTLADADLVAYEPRNGVRLSPAGEKLALHVLRRHRLVELFLVRVVGLDWSEVHAEAEELEHVISEKVLERIDVLLGHPTVDPHGDPIPTAGGHVAVCDGQTLVTCPVGGLVEITRVLDQEPAFLQFVHGSGLAPGARVRVRERNAQAESVVVEREGGGAVTLSVAAGGKFLVRDA